MRKILVVLFTFISLMSASAQNWQTSKGYRGFVDLGASIGIGDYGMNAFTVSTTHGYQVVPSYLFVGGGIGVNLHSGNAFLPIYADFRSHILTGKWSPFVDVRVGYAGSMSSDWEFSDGGMNFNPSVGINLAVSRKIGLELSVGYVYQDAVVVKWNDFDICSNLAFFNNEQKIRKNIGGINIRFGISF